MRLGDAPTQVEPQTESARIAAAGRIGAIKRLGRAINLFGRHAGAMICHAHDRCIAGGIDLDFDGFRIRRGVADGILDEVLDQQPDSGRVQLVRYGCGGHA